MSLFFILIIINNGIKYTKIMAYCQIIVHIQLSTAYLNIQKRLTVNVTIGMVAKTINKAI